MHIGFHAIVPEKSEPGAPPPDLLYLLHGLSDDDSIWLRRTSIDRYASERNLAVVMPNAFRSFYVNAVDGDRLFDYVTEELPEMVRNLFRVTDDPARTYIAGNSMGGFGAMRCGLLKPDRYAAAASLAGVLNLAAHAETFVSRGPRESADARRIFGDIQTIAGSDSDLPDLLRRQHAAGVKLPKLYACCGRDDFLWEHQQPFVDAAREVGADFTWEPGEGEHDWDYWNAWIPRVLDWLPRSVPTT